MSDLEALWRAVLANPDEDTPRLMYADEMEGADPERAELIRAMCEGARMVACDHEQRPDKPEFFGATGCPFCRLVKKGYTLLKANRERWEPACVACGGEKFEKHENAHILVGRSRLPATRIRHQCRACNGTGRQPCRWERGFPVVHVAQMRQVWRVTDVMLMSNPPQSVWEPTPWLRALLRTHHVAGVVPGDERLARGENVPPRVWELWELMGAGKLAMPALGRAVVLAALEWLDARGET